MRERVESGDGRLERNRDIGDSMARSFDLVAVPAVLAVIGVFLDRWIGTAPLLTIVLTVFGVVGAFVATYCRYSQEMQKHEERRTAGRRRAGRKDVAA